MTDKRFLAIEKNLKKKKEKVLVDLIIKDYDKCNFYVALVFNERIEKFKVLFVPVDVLEIDKVDDYCCYQFININVVNCMLESIASLNRIYKNNNYIDKLSKTMDAYYIEINTHVGGVDCKFLTTQIIPKEWDYLFDIIVTLFEHSPNIVSELCNTILELFTNYFYYVRYDYSFDIDFARKDLGLFSKEEMEFGTKKLKDVKFAELVQNNYIVLIDDKLFAFAINTYKKIFNVYIEDKTLDKGYIYTLYLVFKNYMDKRFIKLVKNSERYFVYDIDEDNFLAISDSNKVNVSLKEFLQGDYKILDVTKEFKDKLIKMLKKNFTKDEISDIVEKIQMRKGD